MNRPLAAFVVMVVVAACSGAGESAATDLWPPPAASRPPGVPDGHPLAPIVAASQAGDCSALVPLSSELMASVSERVAGIFHPDGSVDTQDREPVEVPTSDGDPPTVGSALAAEAMRDILDEYVHAEPALLEIGPYGFRFPDWWTADYAYCLAAEERYAEAADVYVLMLQDGTDADIMWRLALVYAWAGRETDALRVLEAWPDAQPAPPELAPVLGRLRHGESVPRSLPTSEVPR